MCIEQIENPLLSPLSGGRDEFIPMIRGRQGVGMMINPVC
jgi:hypothetical protein